ncbi:hypothetical protein ACEWY4_020450 [Coilia grayii]|uniref:Reverse transcriptase/retrotransposon-derived protein RNase H-like domain-containing protein n=1 Tax=Coilia grayii TaxID=363190 RepID=A0ABD1JCN9_9TELE
MRTVYCILASQYDPLGFIIPYTTRAKVLVQALWRTERQWDDPILDDLLPLWEAWESELTDLQNVTIPRRYTPFNITIEDVELHVFCDASEKAYGAVAYIRVVDSAGQTHVSFVLARSRVAPKRRLSIPRLELCTALTGAQLAKTSFVIWLHGQIVPEEVFATVLVEVEGILNSKPLGYVSSDVADPDPITPNLLLMGQRDASMPQALYGPEALLGQRLYRHSQVIGDHFWNQFIRRYLPNLQL